MRLPKGGVALFDSGIGGLTVLAACKKILPNQLFYYYGDNANAPYGNLPVSRIDELVDRAFTLFQKLEVKAVVLACNTVTAVCAQRLREKYAFPIVGAEPALLPALKKGKKILVLATKATRESPRFALLKKRASSLFPNAEIVAPACDELAGVIERGIGKEDFDLAPYLPQQTADAVVLGCTHYLYAKPQIERFYGCECVDGNEGIANRLAVLLSEKLKHIRDEQPLVTPICCEEGFFQTKDDFQAKNGANVFFLGTGKYKNRTIYEQMFAIPYK